MMIVLFIIMVCAFVHFYLVYRNYNAKLVAQLLKKIQTYSVLSFSVKDGVVLADVAAPVGAAAQADGVAVLVDAVVPAGVVAAPDAGVAEVEE